MPTPTPATTRQSATIIQPRPLAGFAGAGCAEGRVAAPVAAFASGEDTPVSASAISLGVCCGPLPVGPTDGLCERGAVVVASDTTHLYAHFEQGRVFPITYNVGEVLAGYDTLRRLAASPAHVVPGHDPLVLARYPAARSGLEGWVVRLDAEPKGG